MARPCLSTGHWYWLVSTMAIAKMISRRLHTPSAMPIHEQILPARFMPLDDEIVRTPRSVAGGPNAGDEQ